jgi:TRAP transporter TAXI family solute receptor
MRLLNCALSLAAVAAAAFITASGAVAQDVKLPATLTFTAYDTGTHGFNVTVAVGKMFKDKYGTDVRVLPAGNDVARLAPLRAGRAHVAAMGAGVYFAQEGVFEFSTRDWGPQPLSLQLTTLDCNGGSLGVARDTGVKEVKDLKGKRLGFVVGSPALNQNALAVLAFAGLTRNDVKIVEFASYGAMWKGMLNNDVDAAFASTLSAPTKELETSPRGIVWPPLPHADKAGWDRMLAVAPFFAPKLATCGSGGISPTTPIELSNYPYPSNTVHSNLDPNLVYAMTKAMIDGYDLYKDGAPGASGFAANRQVKRWAVPYHPAAVRALKEAGTWDAADDEANNQLIKRQQVLQAAWAGYLKSNPPADDAPFRAGWLAARREALGKASLAIGVDETPTQ